MSILNSSRIHTEMNERDCDIQPTVLEKGIFVFSLMEICNDFDDLKRSVTVFHAIIKLESIKN